MTLKKEKDRNALIKGYNMLLYFAGSMIVYEPTEECVTDFWSDGNLKALPVSSSNPRFVLAASQLRGSCQDKALCTSMLNNDFKRLFSDPANPLAPPLSSLYNKNELLPESRRADCVTAFYEAYGWKSGSRHKIPDEHLGTKLLFLSLLLDKHSTLDDPACLEEIRNEIRRFIILHILSWVPQWNERMQQHSETLCYKGIATLIYACAEDIFDLLGARNTDCSFSPWIKN